jgi:hypothetical protein
MQTDAILLITGLGGIIIVLLFAISMGISNSTLTMPYTKECSADSNKNVNIIPPSHKSVNKKSSYTLSRLLSVGTCPDGYINFTDSNGNSLCCGSANIDVFNHTCAAPGREGVCSMSPGIEDTRQISGDVEHYPLCQKIAYQQQEERSGKFCPKKYPNHIAIPGANGQYKCCAGLLKPGATDCLNSASCSSLVGSQNMFNTPTSCETVRMFEKLMCPPGTQMVPNMPGTSVKTKGLSIPVCVGVKGNCMPKKSLDALRDLGYFQDIDPSKNIMNCEVYNKVYNERLLNTSQVDMKYSEDLS